MGIHMQLDDVGRLKSTVSTIKFHKDSKKVLLFDKLPGAHYKQFEISHSSLQIPQKKTNFDSSLGHRALQQHNHDTVKDKIRKTNKPSTMYQYYDTSSSKNLVGSRTDIGAITYKKPVKSKVYEDLGIEQNMNERL